MDLHRLGVWRLPKFHVPDPQFTSELKLWFPRRTDSILSLRKFLAQIGSRLVDTLHPCLSVFGLCSAVAHFVLRKSPSLFLYPGLLTRPLHHFEYSLGEEALGCFQTVEALLVPRPRVVVSGN
jgi:hypothetical protein